MSTKQEKYQALYQKAENLNDWTLLKGFPSLLWSWQLRHPKDVQAIALYSKQVRENKTQKPLSLL